MPNNTQSGITIVLSKLGIADEIVGIAKGDIGVAAVTAGSLFSARFDSLETLSALAYTYPLNGYSKSGVQSIYETFRLILQSPSPQTILRNKGC
jgi:hypothetical protein